MIGAEYTKDCPREDCRIRFDMSGTSTLMAWSPVYDKDGNDVSGGNPNIHTSGASCDTCGRRWVSRTQYGKTVTTEKR